MLRSLTVLLALTAPAASFLFGGCCAPQLPTPCCQSTSWAYAPPRVIGYERIPLYAKVPVPPPPPPPSYPTRMPPPASSYYPPPPPPPPSPPMYSESPSSPQSPSGLNYDPNSAQVPQVIPLPPQQGTAMPRGFGGSPSGGMMPGGMMQGGYAPGGVNAYDEGGDTIPLASPPQGYAQPFQQQPQSAPQQFVNTGYQQTVSQDQLSMGPVEQGVEVSADSITGANYGSQGAPSNYGPQGAYGASSSSSYGSQQAQGFIQSAGQAAFENAGAAPSARRLRLFKN